MTELTADNLRKVMAYDPSSGAFTWLARRSQRVLAGSVAGSICCLGYRTIGIEGRCYKAHRLAWLITYGKWPSGHLDHINGDRADNRIANLRMATVAGNMQNRGKMPSNKSGFKGVWFRLQRKRWVASISVDGRQRHLGTFHTPEQASAAYAEAARRLHGEFARID